MNFARLYRDFWRLSLALKTGGHVDDELSSLILSIEDRRFALHPGFDALAIFRAGVSRSSEARGGASTITMQFVRLVCHRRERTLRRKVRETAMAWWLTRKSDRSAIFAAYIRNAYFGFELRGVEQAARAMFEKGVAECTREEKAELAALLRYPRPKEPSVEWQGKVFRRAQLALERTSAIEGSKLWQQAMRDTTIPGTQYLTQ